MSRAARVFPRGRRFSAWMMMARQLHFVRRVARVPMEIGICPRTRERVGTRKSRWTSGSEFARATRESGGASAGQLSIDRYTAATACVSPDGATTTPAGRLPRISIRAAGEGPARTMTATFRTSSLPALVASSVAGTRSDACPKSDARWAFVDADATGEREPTRAQVRLNTKKTDGVAAEDLLDVSETWGWAAVGTDKPGLCQAGRPSGRHPRYLRPTTGRPPVVWGKRQSRLSTVGALDCTVAVVRRVDVPPPRRPAQARGHHFGGSVTPPAPHYAGRAVFFHFCVAARAT